VILLPVEIECDGEWGSGDCATGSNARAAIQVTITEKGKMRGEVRLPVGWKNHGSSYVICPFCIKKRGF